MATRLAPPYSRRIAEGFGAAGLLRAALAPFNAPFSKRDFRPGSSAV